MKLSTIQLLQQNSWHPSIKIIQLNINKIKNNKFVHSVQVTMHFFAGPMSVRRVLFLIIFTLLFSFENQVILPTLVLVLLRISWPMFALDNESLTDQTVEASWQLQTRGMSGDPLTITGQWRRHGNNTTDQRQQQVS